MGKRLQHIILKEDILVANMCVQMCSISLTIRETQIKTSLQDHNTSTKMDQWKDEK